MAYKGPGRHRKSYETDCKCKTHLFANFSDAINHLTNCEQSTAIFYVSQTGEKQKVRDKKNG
jgi:Uri superfamily endonuclease